MFDYDGWIDDFDSRLDEAAVYRQWMEGDAVEARYEFGLGNYNTALDLIISAVYGAWHFADILVPWLPKLQGLWRVNSLAAGIRDDFTELCNGAEYELTLTKMLGAYIAAPDIDRRSHRYLLDAFSASLYDKPFDLSYHTEWVQRFKSWE